EKGAFTGAQKKSTGYIQRAQNGTLFLDEVNSIPLHIQVKLLRVIDQREINPVGNSKTVKVNFRLIAASNSSLTQMVKDNKFRSDFFYRLNVIYLKLPNLAQRKEDIPDLTDHFVSTFNTIHKTGTSRNFIPDHVTEQLLNYPWPGNIRELKNIIYRYLATGRLMFNENILATGVPVKKDNDCINPAALQHFQDNPNTLPLPVENQPLKPLMEDFEKRYIQKILIETRYNKAEVARILDINRKSLYLKLEKYGID
ncbi:MAG: sigma-54-dependent Fis family transcriptional regulator, partial [Desulfobacteraceae bacterium]|nr:sigma-54-dependent Fis family transcriptional regulator [Desulfobacteraceae bacterium]